MAYQTPPPTPPRKSRQILQEQYYRDVIEPYGVRIAAGISFGCVFVLGWVTYDYSSENNPNYYRYARKLSNGWIFGRPMDNSDVQYRSFRNNIPILVGVLVLHQLITFALRRIFERGYQSLNKSDATWKVLWNGVFSTVFLFALFGLSLLKIWALLTIHYLFIKACKSKIGPLFSWIFGVAILFSNHAFQGYRFGVITSLGWMDGINGIGMNWQTSFNFCVLRMVSFSMDYYWMYTLSPQGDLHVEKCTDCDSIKELCEKGRIERPRTVLEYNYINYLVYTTYAPLYLAGPIISFNNFMEQFQKTPRTITRRSTLMYGLRWVGIVLLMEIILHLFHVVAIKDTRAWEGFSSLQIFTLGFFNLKVIWLKVIFLYVVDDHLAFLSALGVSRWCRNTRKYDQVHDKSLFRNWILEKLAHILQQMADTIFVCAPGWSKI
jgi:D-alanyl-lipoteichoic acid acyltransferase DltB (MBOAT superfamily)